MSTSQLKVGIFDSGIGGLSIAKELKVRLPDLPLIYWADSAYSPYGELPGNKLLQRCQVICQQFISQGCQIIVIACNTATVNCIKQLRSQFAVTFIGVEPGIKPAILQAKSNVAVFATARTIESEHYQAQKRHLLQQTAELQVGSERSELSFDQRAISDVKCYGLADAIELLHDVDNDTQLVKLIEGFLNSLSLHEHDVLVLGCTHYNLIKAKIISTLNYLNHNLTIIDTAAAVVSQIERKIAEVLAEVSSNDQGSEDKPMQDLAITSGSLSTFSKQLDYWLGYSPNRQIQKFSP